MTGISHVAIWDKSILDRGNRECKGTFWNSKEAGVTEQSLAEGSLGVAVRVAVGTRLEEAYRSL